MHDDNYYDGMIFIPTCKKHADLLGYGYFFSLSQFSSASITTSTSFYVYFMHVSAVSAYSEN